MIYQILFVFALLIVALNNASDRAIGIPNFITEFHFEEATNEKLEEWNSYKMCDQTIEWDPNKLGWTQILPRGFYGVYKKCCDTWEVFKEFVIEDEAGMAIALSKFVGFKLDATYVIYGVTHKHMKFNHDHIPIDKDSLLRAEIPANQAKLARSSAWCFNDELNALKVLTKAQFEEWKRDSTESIEWDVNKPSCTVALPRGLYTVWKKDDDVWRLFKTVVVEGDEVISVDQYYGFKGDDTYVILGIVHPNAKFERDAVMEWKISDDCESELPGTLSYSSEMRHCVSDASSERDVEPIHETPHRESKETNGWSFKKKMMIFGLIAVTVVLAFCACCVLGWHHLKKKRMNSLRVEEEKAETNSFSV